MFFFEALFLMIALSLDALAAGLSYGTKKIAVPPSCLAVISAICSGMLCVSLLFGGWIHPYIPPTVAKFICFGILFAMGFCKLFDSVIKGAIRKRPNISLKISAFQLHFVLQIYADAEAADADHSHSLSIWEAAYLSVALSLDGMAAGFGVSVSGMGVLLPMLLSLVITAAAMKIGVTLGKKLISVTDLDLSWISGALFIFLALFKL